MPWQVARLAAETMQAFLQTGDARQLAQARKRFMKSHGRVFWVLGMMQKFWYVQLTGGESGFVSMCADPDVQRLTWEAYMNKELVRGNPMAHVRIFFKDLAHLLGHYASQHRTAVPTCPPARSDAPSCRHSNPQRIQLAERLDGHSRRPVRVRADC
jgi:hypothetical protein